MFEKNMRFALLLDFYSAVLDGHTASILKAYYEDDLSLAEIAEGEGISRQGVRHIIKKGEDELEFFESRLSLSKRSAELSAFSEEINSVIKNIEADCRRDDIERLQKIADALI